MRLDLYLKGSRLCPRRSVAQQLCEAQLVFVNGHPAKPAHNVKPDDEIIVRRHSHEKRVRVIKLPVAQQPRSTATTLYELISERDIADN